MFDVVVQASQVGGIAYVLRIVWKVVVFVWQLMSGKKGGERK